jgi:hypothetical protein
MCEILVNKGPIQFIREKQSMYFYYYMTRIPTIPCEICIVEPMCSKSVFKGTACDLFVEFINKKEKEVEEEGVWIYT